VEENSHHLEDAGNSKAGHELRDVQVGPIVWFCIGLVLIVTFSFWGTRIMFNYFANREAKSSAPAVPLVSERPELPPEPRLQVSPVETRKQIRAADDSVLNSYGWVNQPSGIVRIPIDRAMKLLAERGLPVRPESSGQKADAKKRGQPSARETR
jgi:hypothetical protein